MRTVTMMLVVMVGLCGCEKNDRESEGQDPRPATVTPSEPEPAQEEPSIAEALAKMDYAEALATTRPLMDDTSNTHSDGTMLLAIWAAQAMVWTDVHVENDETSFGKVMKDPNAERGKRMCWSGRIIQITREQVDAGSVFSGLLLTRRRNIISFFAAGSTGDLVGGSRGRFCGVVTGKYSYSNSGGGTSHAIAMVGMFKLPENLD